MVVGILGVLEAGGAYVPLDPKAPETRIKYILQECSIKILLSKVSKDRGAAPISGMGEGIELILIDEVIKDFTIPPTHLTHLTHPTHPCYIIFTSGSTGNPKGVPITHANLSPLLHWGYELGLGAGDPPEPGLLF
jgi:non-ribosomal peptide synthetase component F